jgi:hypothetical protein
MVIEVLPKLIIAHLVDLCDMKRHVSIVAIRRLVNFLRLFRLLMKMHPEITKFIDTQLENFITKPEMRIKDHCASLGDLLAYSIISEKWSFTQLLEPYLEE